MEIKYVSNLGYLDQTSSEYWQICMLLSRQVLCCHRLTISCLLYGHPQNWDILMQTNVYRIGAVTWKYAKHEYINFDRTTTSCNAYCELEVP
jgi:hypothetical protein